MKKLLASGSLLILPAAFFLMIIGLVEAVIFVHKGNLETSQKLDTLGFGVDLRARSESELNSVLHLTSGLGGYFSVRHDSLEAEEIREILAVVHQTNPHLRNLGVAVGYELTYIYPPQGNESAIGIDYRQLPKQWPGVKRAITERRSILSPQITLVQGGQGFIFREPIYVHGEYWGLLSSVIDSRSLLQTLFGDVKDSRYQFAVRNPGGDPELLWGKASLFNDPAAVTLESVHGWEFSVKPLVTSASALPMLVMRLFGWVLALVTALGIYTALLHRRALTHLTLHDSVTGLPNPNLVSDRIALALRRSRRNPDQGKAAVIFIGLDDFKFLKSELGPGSGNQMIRDLAQSLEACARAGDTLGRWSDEEFVLVLENVDQDTVRVVLDRLEAVLAKPFEYQGKAVHLSATIGYTLATDDTDRPMNLIWAADRDRYGKKG